jgi:hypothetical protein
MMIFIAQLVSVVDKVSQEGANRADNYTKARATLDAFSRDVRVGIFRPDLAAFADANGNNALCFYTCRPGNGAGVRNISLIVYQLNAATGSLQRGALPLQWSDNPSQISFANTGSLPLYSTVVANDMVNVVNGVLRIEVYFVNSGGALSKSYSSQSLAVGITLAVVDQQTLNVLSSTKLSALTSSSGALPDDPSTNPTQTLGSFWAQKMAVPGFYNGYPEQLRSGLRIFEQYIELPLN